MRNELSIRLPAGGLGLAALILLGGASGPAHGAATAAAGGVAGLSARGSHAARTLVAKKKKKQQHSAPAPADDGENADAAGDAEASGTSDGAGKSGKADDDAAGSDDTGDGTGATAHKGRLKAASLTESDDATRASDDDAGGSAKPKLAVERTAEPPAAAEAAGTAFELGLGAMALFRQLAWTSDARAAGLGSYSLTPGPEAGLWMEFYPGAFATTGFASNLGLFARYNYGFGVTSKLQSGVDAGTKYQDFLAGIKVRIPLGTFTPYGTVAYGEQTFSIAAQGTAQDLPAMDYSFVRIGAGTRIGFSPIVELDAGLAFLSITDAGSAMGQLASSAYFPRTSAYAGELGASLAIRLASKIGVRLGVDLRQYGLAFHPQTGDSHFVSGAVDRYIVAWSGLEVLLDGQGAGAGSDDEPAPRHKHHRRAPEPTDEDSAPESAPEE